ncbi:MAG: hypothetical protein IKE76_03950 [Clostridia bacterium]|nr:hypothetical protein [Clostridia bacterium]
MRSMRVRGDALPSAQESTATAYIVRTGIVPFSETDEQGNVSQGYEWTELRLEPGEYQLVREGKLPAGAEWDNRLRRIRLLAQLEATDYVAAKLAEAEGEELAQLRQEYAEIIAQRKAWRAAINSL